MSEAPGGGIFVSYRRQESSHLAGRLYDRLTDRFGDDQVFIDVDKIEPGVDFAEEIERAVATCQVLLAVIGPTWLTAVDGQGRRRLDDPDDIVRLEIEAALARDVRVIPIRVEGVVMPRRQELPKSLANLARRNGFAIRHESFRSDVERLIQAIERVLAGPTSSGALGESAAQLADSGRQVLQPASMAPAGIGREAAARGRDDPGWTPRARARRLLADAERTAQSIDFEAHKRAALSDLARVLAVIDPGHAERVARSITGESKALALSHIANALTVTDPDRAGRLVAEAERTAESIAGEPEYEKPWALSRVAQVLATTHPDDAERIAQSITGDYWKASVLSHVAEALTPTDPDRAARLLTDAEHIAKSITNEQRKAAALRGIVEALALSDPERAAGLLPDAERAAQSITDQHSKESALSLIAQALAVTDPDRAERMAQSLSIENVKAWALKGVAERLATTDPDRAERIAESITSEYPKASALREIAKALAATDAGRAERIAQGIAGKYKDEQALALIGVAETLAATDPDRAGRLINDAERTARSINEGDKGARALAGVAKAVAATDPDHAERVVRSIIDSEKQEKARAFIGVAEVLLVPPNRIVAAAPK